MNQLSTRKKVAPATRNGGRRSNGTSDKGRATPAEVSAPAGTRVSRVVLRRVDPWSVLKVSVLFFLSVCIVLLTAGVLLWVGARTVGVIENVESFLDQIGFTDFQFVPGQMLRGAALGGVVLVGTGTFASVLMAVLYNLINDVVGGIRVTLAEDDDVPLRP